MTNNEPLELAESTASFEPPKDIRPKMPEPLPVRLIAVSDVYLPAQVGLQREMDALYIGLLRFVRGSAADGEWIYQADNFQVRMNLHESLIERSVYRPLQVEVPSLADLEARFVEAEIEYARQRGLVPGMESLLLMDPSSNYVEITEYRRVM